MVKGTVATQEDVAMRYALLINTDEHALSALATDEASGMTAEYMAWSTQATEAGVLLGGERLQPTSTATTVRVRDGETLVTDGPYAETKEQFGGYFLVECPDLDAAIDWASKIPGASHGAIEVRPIWELS